eukprot:3479377-Pleurochrysis_carterae.AAC.1
MKPQTVLQCSTIELQALYMLNSSNKTASMRKAPTQTRSGHKEADVTQSNQPAKHWFYDKKWTMAELQLLTNRRYQLICKQQQQNIAEHCKTSDTKSTALLEQTQ